MSPFPLFFPTEKRLFLGLLHEKLSIENETEREKENK